MALDRHKLLDVLLDNQSISDSELILKIERIISESKPYNHKASEIQEACRITDIASSENNSRDFSALVGPFKTISSRIEVVESMFTKRELSFLLIENLRKVEKAKDVINTISKLKDDF